MKRIELLDVWRSLAVLLMLGYHLLYDLYVFGAVGQALALGTWVHFLRIAVAGSFFLISGAVAHCSRNNLRRGAITLCCGMAVSVVMSFTATPVHFGVLHCLGILGMLYGACASKLPIPKSAAFPIVCLILFGVLYWLNVNVLLDTNLLMPFLLRSAAYSAADYYPLLPWAMLYAAGLWMGRRMDGLREGHRVLRRSFHPALSFPGKHALVIYLAHQPLFYGVCWLIWGR